MFPPHPPPPLPFVQVIVVSLNYRLGLLGWGAFIDDTTGKLITNLGLQDQQLALGTHSTGALHIYLHNIWFLFRMFLSFSY
jgi:hypothetical protein